MMIDVKLLVEEFLHFCVLNQIELYNEPSLQYELAIFLRNKLSGTDLVVQLERNVSYFSVQKDKVRKREIDIAIFNRDQSFKAIIELKYSTKQQGKVPERMYEVCSDILFTEQLREEGFNQCVVLFIAENKDFWFGRALNSPYFYFRAPNNILTGSVSKPTGSRGKLVIDTIMLKNRYQLIWQDFKLNQKYVIVEV